MNNKLNKNLIYIFSFLVIAGIGLSNSLGLQEGTFKAPIYYTSLSGLICFVYFFIALLRGIYKVVTKNDEMSLFVLPRFKGAVTICITVTFLVYHFMVYEGPILSIDTDIYNLIPHYIVPIMVILHYFIYDEKGIYKRIDPILWLIIPILYFAWANFKAITSTAPFWGDKWYPYGFMDLTKHSLNSVIITIVLLIMFFIILGYALYMIDNGLKEEKLMYKGNKYKSYKAS